MLREVRKLLFDIQQSGGPIRQFVAEATFEAYQRDRMMQSAVERQFGIIGEALHSAIGWDRSPEQRITAADRIIAFRDRLIHGYADVSAMVVGGVIESHLPVLLREVEDLLRE